MKDEALRCRNCKWWLGESAVDLVYVEHVERGSESTVAAPRDLRLCQNCRRVNVFISRKDLDRTSALAVR